MRPASETGVLTVAGVRKRRGKRATEYLFNERQQIYQVRPRTKSGAASARLLTRALKDKRPVRAVLDPKRGFIKTIRAPSKTELAEFEKRRVLLEKPEKPRRVEVSAIDPTRFNLVDHYLKFPVFRRCTKIVPSYTKAKQIFDYCAAQSCHLPGPPDVSPCIPFQYVIDGCYARAHKMRRIITEKFGYCCEKVFSFANEGDDKLAVTADKWGGCCVVWWYHVAPLIRVKVKLGKWSVVLALVVDPSMFDKPVLLSSWLGAQEKKACYPDAQVSMYSIQPGSAFWPADDTGTSFGEDNDYYWTDLFLEAYHDLTTCS